MQMIAVSPPAWPGRRNSYFAGGASLRRGLFLVPIVLFDECLDSDLGLGIFRDDVKAGEILADVAQVLHFILLGSQLVGGQLQQIRPIFACQLFGPLSSVGIVLSSGE